MNPEPIDRYATTKIAVEDAQTPHAEEGQRGIDAQDPDRMPRAEDDERTRANSPEFHDRPGSGKYITPRDVRPDAPVK
jgi:hypothetical protein